MRLLMMCALGLTLAAALAAKDKEFVMPRAFHANTYPAHDAHTDEKFSIAADPYDMPDKQKSVFSTDYKERGIMPVLMVLSNDGDDAVNVSSMKVVIITRDRTKLLPLAADDVFRMISRGVPGDNPGGEKSKIPLPIPQKRKTPVSTESRDEVQNGMFMARAVEPHSTQSGFMFFDVRGIDQPLAGARLEVTGIQRNGQELFYFEVPMEKYLSYKP